ncbi:GMC family oxidoreductase [Aquibaculum arenosum]|uniref:GMC family oxidoreductase n=1 Tax=Aquibaculum arenosum TaxID=3032591 RepID=A0ABT5YJ46_9PROT|nr:GMC family oxidoreductase [Fodinicurvata sp. CAU 1616]MDF2094963.1 GMC family oxidoreductase [Fodinicurvata sp. CAU 1616]
MKDLVADVVVVGSGVAGALTAAQLAAKGVDVAILEAGAKVDRPEGVERFWNAAIKVPECPYPPRPEAMHPVSDNHDGWYRQAGPESFGSTYLKVVGGTTWHWLGTSLRYLPSDFQLKTHYGRGVDWPISYDEIEPFYARAEEELGVAGDAADDLGSPRSNGYPMPPVGQTYLDRQIAKALADSEYQLRATPQARNVIERDGRPPCCGSASCIPICPVQAKYDATVHLDKAIAAGARLYERSTAIFIEASGTGQITAIRFRRWDGSEGIAQAKVFLLAAHAIESPRLLLASRGENTPQGVANASNQVGRHLMDHPVQLSWALTKEPVWPYRGPTSTSGIENLRDGAFRRERGAFRVEIGNDGWIWPTGGPVMEAAALVQQGLRGKELDAALAHQAARHIRIGSLVEQLPDADNRVTLDPEAKDVYGVPLPRLSYDVDAYTRAGMATAKQVHDEIFQRLGTTQVQHAPNFFGAGHIIGTTRMGEDPKSSVVDRNLRSHDHPNLFILGSSVFPTSATANPTLTIAALSLRVVEPVLASLRS